MLLEKFYLYLYFYLFSDGPYDWFYISGYLSSLQSVVYTRVCVRARVRAT
jgi:hypothetical protein